MLPDAFLFCLTCITMDNQIYVIDLFCGCGGFSEGARQAGAKIVLAIDNWEKALKIHKIHHPDTEHWDIELGGDIDEMYSKISHFIEQYTKDNIHIHIHIHASPRVRIYLL